MSDILPLFNSAPRMILYVNKVKVAYAVGFNINVAMNVEPVQVIGEYISQAMEPLFMPPVTGTLSLIRPLTPESQAGIKTAANAKGTSDNPAGTYTDLHKKGEVFAPAIDNTSGSGSDFLNNENLYRHLDPATVLISQTFDIVIHLKVPKVGLDPTTGKVNYVDVKAKDAEEEWMYIKDCRITSKTVNIAPGALLYEPLEFSGLLVQNAALSDKAREQLDSNNAQT